MLLGQQSDELARKIDTLEKKPTTLPVRNSTWSPKQLQVLFLKSSGYDHQKTPKGAPSTAEEVLVELALDFPCQR